jgi:cysteinyl-tRNA synthetase
MKRNIKIFNTLSGKKDILKISKRKKINLFVCGPTVFDYSHIGHAKNYVVFDVFTKYLRFCGFKVFYLQGITNLDDKIIARAREKKVNPKDLALAFEKEYLKDMADIGINSVSKYARATDHIKEIISQVERLQKKGYAYIIDEDGIYYNIKKFKDYGKLAGRSVLQAEDSVTRIDYSKNKKNRGDFCLWKFKQDDLEPYWSAPFGQGRPGWHIEDTAISEKFFGAQYDIHGAARDLIFPHHEAEISQMEAISGKVPMVKYWMHVGFLTVNGQKMSKTVGNFITIKDFLRRYPANYLRFFVIKNLWASPIDYSESTLIEVKAAIEKIEEFLRRLKTIKIINKNGATSINKAIAKIKTDFYNELDDNFNTPKALAVMFDFIKSINQFLDLKESPLVFSKKQSDEIFTFFKEINEIFGIINFRKINEIIPKEIKMLAKDRQKYRAAGEWQKADQARMQIEKEGYVINDTNNGPAIKKVV